MCVCTLNFQIVRWDMLRIFLTILKRTEHWHVYTHFLLQILDRKLSLACPSDKHQQWLYNFKSLIFFFAFKLHHHPSSYHRMHRALHLSLLMPYYIKFSRHISFMILRFTYFTILKFCNFVKSFVFWVTFILRFSVRRFIFWQFNVKIPWPK